MKLAYNYDKTSNIYTGATECRLDPLELELNGKEIYLLPANATFEPVPEFDNITQYVIWNGSVWDVLNRVPEQPNELSQAEKREEAYRTALTKEDGTPLILWLDDNITVDMANDLWLKYSAEGSVKATELSGLIATAKEYIRNLYPDVA